MLRSLDAHLSGALSPVNWCDALRHDRTPSAPNVDVKTIEQVREERLRLLLGEAGSLVGLNRQLDMNERDSTFSQILSPKTQKSMGSDLARRLERGFGKPTGWMDTDPDLEWPFMAIAPAAYRSLDPRVKGMIEQAAHDILQRVSPPPLAPTQIEDLKLSRPALLRQKRQDAA